MELFAHNFPAKFVVSVKPTESQFGFFLQKYGFKPKDYWSIIGKFDESKAIFKLLKNAVAEAFAFAAISVAERLKELNIGILDKYAKMPNFIYILRIPSAEVYQKVVGLPEVRSVVQSEEITLPNDEPKVPEEIEKAIENWNPHSASYKLAAEYIEKKKEESGNITYIYSEKHIKQRNKKKVKRILQLDKSLKKLRKKIQEDLKNDDLKPVAMVVALIDDTYERVGNPSSAEENHFGVTTWRKKHISFSKGKAKIKYKGKAGVDQEKFIKNPTLIKDLKELVKDKKANDELFPNVSAKDVNKYLRPFKITAKDIRGFHANYEMKKALRSVKSDEKDPEKRKKDKFKKALEETAKMVGHNPSTLKNQYLAPSIEKSWFESGKIQIKAGFEYSGDFFSFLPDQKEPPKGYINPIDPRIQYPHILLTDAEKHFLLELEEEIQNRVQATVHTGRSVMIVRNETIDGKPVAYALIKPIVRTPLKEPTDRLKRVALSDILMHFRKKNPEMVNALLDKIAVVRRSRPFKYDAVIEKSKIPPEDLEFGLPDMIGFSISRALDEANINIPHHTDEDDNTYFPRYVGRTRFSRYLAMLQKKFKNNRHLAENIEKALKIYSTLPVISEWTLIISAEPSDILNMSTKKGWRSCVSEGKCNFAILDDAVSARDMVAYAVTSDHPNWLARVWLRFDGKSGWWPEAKIYKTGALDSDEFRAAVENYLKSHDIRGETGTYSPHASGWSDLLENDISSELSPEWKALKFTHNTPKESYEITPKSNSMVDHLIEKFYDLGANNVGVVNNKLYVGLPKNVAEELIYMNDPMIEQIRPAEPPIIYIKIVPKPNHMNTVKKIVDQDRSIMIENETYRYLILEVPKIHRYKLIKQIEPYIISSETVPEPRYSENLAVDKPTDFFHFLPKHKEPPKGYIKYSQMPDIKEPHVVLSYPELEFIHNISVKLETSLIYESHVGDGFGNYKYSPLTVKILKNKKIKQVPLLSIIDLFEKQNPVIAASVTDKIRTLLNKKDYRYDITPQEKADPETAKFWVDHVAATEIIYALEDLKLEIGGILDSSSGKLFPMFVGKTRFSRYLAVLQKKYKNDPKILNAVQKALKAYSLAPKIQEWNLVVSAEPSDIQNMSTGRGWTSCMTQDGANKDDLDSAISNRDMIAYAISPDQKNWISRVWLRFDGKSGWWPETKLYRTGALDDKVFLNAVENYLKSHNIRGETGKFPSTACGWSDYKFGFIPKLPEGWERFKEIDLDDDLEPRHLYEIFVSDPAQFRQNLVKIPTNYIIDAQIDNNRIYAVITNSLAKHIEQISPPGFQSIKRGKPIYGTFQIVFKPDISRTTQDRVLEDFYLAINVVVRRGDVVTILMKLSQKEKIFKILKPYVTEIRPAPFEESPFAFISPQLIKPAAQNKKLIKLAISGDFGFLSQHKEPPKGYILKQIPDFQIPHVVLSAKEKKALDDWCDYLGITPIAKNQNNSYYLPLKLVLPYPLKNPKASKTIILLDFLNYFEKINPEVAFTLKDKVAAVRGTKVYQYDATPQKNTVPEDQMFAVPSDVAFYIGNALREANLYVHTELAGKNVLFPMFVGKTRFSRYLATLKKKFKHNERILNAVDQALQIYSVAPKMTDWTLIVSAEPSDIINMSNQKGWISCISEEGCNAASVDAAVSARDMVAYAVSPTSPNWISRVWLRFDGKSGWWPEIKVYRTGALGDSPFLTAVQNYLKDKNIYGQKGTYAPIAQGWSDYQHDQIIHKPENWDQLLEVFNPDENSPFFKITTSFPDAQSLFSFISYKNYTKKIDNHILIQTNPEVIQKLKDLDYPEISEIREIKDPFVNVSVDINYDNPPPGISLEDPYRFREFIYKNFPAADWAFSIYPFFMTFKIPKLILPKFLNFIKPFVTSFKVTKESIPA